MNEQIIHEGVQKVTGINHDVSTELKDKFEALFPTWTTVVATVIALLILILVLTKLLYQPIKKMHDDRKNYIQENIDSAEKQNNEAVSDREKANDELIQARLEAAEIINKAKEDSKQVRLDRIEMARLEAEKIIVDAKESMKAQVTKFNEEKQDAIVEVALAAAAKIVEKEVDNKTNRKIIDDFAKGIN